MRNVSAILLLLGIFSGAASWSGAQSISGILPNLPGQKVYLAKNWRTSLDPVDSVVTDAKGKFKISTDDIEPGLYQIYSGRVPAGKIIVADEAVKVGLVVNKWQISSPENKIFQRLDSLVNAYRMQDQKMMESLSKISQFDPRYQAKFDSAAIVFADWAKTKNKGFKNFSNRHKGTIAGDHLAPIYLRPIRTSSAEWKNKYDNDPAFYHDHFFEGLQLDDPKKYRSSLIGEMIFQYFKQYTDHSPEDFERGIRIIYEKVQGSEEAAQLMGDLLFSMFEKRGPESIVLLVNDLFLGQCEADTKDLDLRKKAELIRALQVGNPAPEFTTFKIGGDTLRLSDYRGKNVVLLFWASWCPHCKKKIPTYSETFKSLKRKDLEVIAISLDKNAKEWVQAIKDLDLQWTNASEFRGWRSSTVEQYYIRNIPYTYLIGPDGTIKAKGFDFNKIDSFLD